MYKKLDSALNYTIYFKISVDFFEVLMYNTVKRTFVQ